VLKKRFPSIILQSSVAILLSLLGASWTLAPQQSQPPPSSRPAVHSHRPLVRDTGTAAELCSSCVRDNLTYLAGPALHGRGSGTEDEHLAAQYIAEKLKAYGLTPAADDGQFIQTATLRSREVTGNPTLTIAAKSNGNPQPLVLTYGKQMVVSGLSESLVSATLQKLDLNEETASPDDGMNDAAVLIRLKSGASTEEARRLLEPYRKVAALVIVGVLPETQRVFDVLARHPPHISQQVGDEEPKMQAPLILVKRDVFDQLWSRTSGATVTLQAQITPWRTAHTWNVLAKIEGAGEKGQIILLSAHLDHLGIENGQTYYGADDDASGTAAVMELARILAKEPIPQRTVVVALWGSEELGMVGARYFLQRPTFPLNDIVANLEFEMIGRPDPKLKPDELWFTGWDRTNLGPALARHGAKLVADPRASEKFFTRSDNYVLAQDGIIAQTVSSFGLHADYHQPTDTVDKIDFQHMDQAIASMIGPVTWLANTDFKPQWVEGKRP